MFGQWQDFDARFSQDGTFLCAYVMGTIYYIKMSTATV
jgi:hypothetical protein